MTVAGTRASPSNRYVCIHGHFYQPPRENPWLETIELQDSAYPYHDWNERVSAECYAPNADSRILAEEGRIARIVNNYSRISFNFGPTLLAWLESNDRATYRAILAADTESRGRFSGHGSALAQVYNHAILPLANRRDKITQVRWGIRDFRHRFGRRPEGMWLAETAVDRESLEVLADQGIRFTVLAPSQAARLRLSGDDEWRETTEPTLDTTRPYGVELPGGQSIAVFFYNGAVARAVAFEHLLNSGARFVRRLIDQFPEDTTRPHLVHIATDGETYGHHHRFGDMALAYALRAIESGDDARLTNYGEFLELNPPDHQAEIVEPSSWSCSHGVGRWSDDCGCTTGGHPTWNQSWRKPLREALNWLRDEIAPRFDREARRVFADPWEARDEYVELILDRSSSSIDEFLRRLGRGPLERDDEIRALKLLELQRQLILMYTSCAWFFEEISGIETVQNLQYAARALQLGEELFDVALEVDFLERLALAPSNLPAVGDGRELYEQRIAPTKVDLPRVAANAAASLLFERKGAPDPAPGFEIVADQSERRESGSARLMLGRLSVESRVTKERGEFDFAFVHLGDHNLSGAVRRRTADAEFDAMRGELLEGFSRGDVPAVLRSLERRFDGGTDSLQTLFRDERRRILDQILQSTCRDAEAVHERLFRQHASLMRFIHTLETNAPRALESAAELVLNTGLRRELESPDFEPARLQTLLDEAQSVGVVLDGAGLGFAARAALERMFTQLDERPEEIALLRRAITTTRLVRDLPFDVDLRHVENVYYDIRERVLPRLREADLSADERERAVLFDELGDALRFAAQHPDT